MNLFVTWGGGDAESTSVTLIRFQLNLATLGEIMAMQKLMDFAAMTVSTFVQVNTKHS